MNELYLMVTITDRNKTKRYMALYESCGINVTFGMAGYGTAAGEMLEYFGLEQSEKAVLAAVVTDDTWKEAKRGLERRLQIDVPGTGIAFVIPMSSIGGKKALYYLTDGQNYEKGEETTLKDTKYELLIVIANQGYSNLIMDAAREEGAGGGTVLHAKGTGLERAEKFLGVSLVREKEMVFIVARSDKKHRIMKAVMDGAGLGTKAQAVAFSLPVTSVAGMRLAEADEQVEEEVSRAL